MTHIGLDKGFAPDRPQAIIWNNADPIYWRIYATLGKWVKKAARHQKVAS